MALPPPPYVPPQHHEDTLHTCQWFALGSFLSGWPDKEYDEIIELLSNNDMDDEELVVWEPFEMDDPSSVAEKIEDLVGTALSTFGEALDFYNRSKDK